MWGRMFTCRSIFKKIICLKLNDKCHQKYEKNQLFIKKIKKKDLRK